MARCDAHVRRSVKFTFQGIVALLWTPVVVAATYLAVALAMHVSGAKIVAERNARIAQVRNLTAQARLVIEMNRHDALACVDDLLRAQEDVLAQLEQSAR